MDTNIHLMNITIREQDCYNLQEHCQETAKLLAKFEESTTVEAEIIFDFQTLIDMDSLLEDMDTTLDELNKTTQDYLWLSYVQTQVLTSTDNRNTTVTFQDLARGRDRSQGHGQSKYGSSSFRRLSTRTSIGPQGT